MTHIHHITAENDPMGETFRVRVTPMEVTVKAWGNEITLSRTTPELGTLINLLRKAQEIIASEP